MEVEYKIAQLNKRVNKSIKNKLTLNRTKLTHISQKNIFKNPESIYEIQEMILDNLVDKLSFSSKNIVAKNKNELIRLENSPIFRNPESMYKFKRINLNNVVNRLNITSNKIVTENKNRLFRLENSHILKNPNEITRKKKDSCLKNIKKLEILNPLLTLKRGYAIAKAEDNVISSAKDVKVGDEVDIEFEDGLVNTKVI